MVVWVLIPAYNEEKNIGALVSALKKKSLSVLVIDDGSSDRTEQEAKEKGAEVIKNEKNLGKGGAIKKGISYLLKEEKFDYLIIMDADQQHSPDDVECFLQEARKNVPFVIGNRMANPCLMPKIRVLTNKVMSWIISKIIDQMVADTQCGFKLIRRDILEKIKIKTNKFEIESEFVIKVGQLKIPIKSIPIKSIYFKENSSKIRPLQDTLRFIKFLYNTRKWKKKNLNF